MSNSALPPNDHEMTLVQHLLELRNALTKGILAIIVLFVILFPFANDLYLYISEPLVRYLPEGNTMIATGVISPFLTPFKLSFVLAIYIAMPFLLYQIWSFIAPALYQHERQLIGPLLFFSSFLFYAGGAFAYYVVFPLVFEFMSGTSPDGVAIATDIATYLDFVIKMFFAFGIAFEVPIVVVLLILTGMTTPEKLSHARPYVVVGAFVIGMLLTPPDVISQTLLAIPMWLLYEAGIIVGGTVKKARDKAAKKREREAEQGLDDSDEDYEAEDKNNHDSSPSQEQKPSSAGQTKQQQTKTTAESAKPEDDPYHIPEEEFDNRYADQLEDDEDWDKAFDEIDSEFASLEREYKARQEKERAEKEKQNNRDSDTDSAKEDQANASDSDNNESTDGKTDSKGEKPTA